MRSLSPLLTKVQPRWPWEEKAVRELKKVLIDDELGSRPYSGNKCISFPSTGINEQ